MAGDDTALAPAATPPVVLPFPFPAYDPERAHEDNLPWVLGVLGVVHALAIVVVVCRLYVKVRLVKSIGADDWTITGAVVRFLSPSPPFPCPRSFAGSIVVIKMLSETVALIYNKILTGMCVCVFPLSYAPSAAT